MTYDDPKLQELLCEYLDGQLDEPGRAQVQELLAANPETRALLADMQKLRGWMGELPIQSVPADLAASLQKQIRPPSRSRTLLRLAAVLLVSLGGAVVIWTMLPPPASTQAPLALNSPVPTTAAEEHLKKQDVALDAVANETGKPASLVLLAANPADVRRELTQFLGDNGISYEPVAAPAPAPVVADKEFNTAGANTVTGGTIPGGKVARDELVAGEQRKQWAQHGKDSVDNEKKEIAKAIARPEARQRLASADAAKTKAPAPMAPLASMAPATQPREDRKVNAELPADQPLPYPTQSVTVNLTPQQLDILLRNLQSLQDRGVIKITQAPSNLFESSVEGTVNSLNYNNAFNNATVQNTTRQTPQQQITRNYMGLQQAPAGPRQLDKDQALNQSQSNLTTRITTTTTTTLLIILQPQPAGR